MTHASTYDAPAFSDRLTYGQAWENDVATRLARQGLVLRCCDLPGHASSTVPVGYADDGPIPVPDLLVIRRDGSLYWADPKRKARPSYRRTRRRWEVGCDYAYIQGYQRVQRLTGTPVYFILLEDQEPVDPECESRLQPATNEFCVSLDDVLRCGEHRPDWPGGRLQPDRRGKNGQGGWLWPRSIMHEFDPSMPEVQP